MECDTRTRDELIAEIEALRARLIEAEGRACVAAFAAVDGNECDVSLHLLRESEERQRMLAGSLELERRTLEAVLSSLPVGVWIADKQGCLVGKNQEADRIWCGTAPLVESQEEYRQYPSWDAATGKATEPEEYPLAMALATGEPVEPVEYRIRRFDGTEGVVLASAAPVLDRAGDLLGAVATNLDITQRASFERARKMADEKILRQNVLLNGIGAILRAALTSKSEQELATVCLRMAEEVTGSRLGFIGELREDGLVHDIETEGAVGDAYALNGSADPGRPAPLRLHGLYGEVIVSGRALVTNTPASHPACAGVPPGHPPLQSFLGVPLIHGEKTIGLIALANRAGGYREEDLEAMTRLADATVQALIHMRAEASLRGSELRLLTALEGGKMGMWEWDFTNHRSFWSPMEYQLLGLPAGDGESDSDVFFRHVHPEDQEHLKTSIQSAVNLRDHWEHEFRVIRADGEVRWLVGAGYVLEESKGKAVRMIGINYDITERKQLEQELRLAHDTLEQRVRERTVELQASNRELESFSYSVTHELGAPLRAMNSFSHILMEDYGELLDDEGRNYLTKISAAASRMGHLVEDLLKLSRVTRRKLKRETVQLSELAEEVVCNLRIHYPQREVKVTIDGGVEGHWDPSLASLALQNLIGNAWKYTGKIANPEVHFGSYSDGRETVYFVRDNGIGFEMSYADKIFLPFERLHKIGEYEGNGIGLATVQRVIAMHGGRIWAQGAAGEGATFFFTDGWRGYEYGDGGLAMGS
ncbi:GAF domain-containing protein [Geomonas sp. Red32]|uniref:GAF domain-containing protein n=1 Tax=Geomonas sp. Red32 TaxID=2912856 RepID=UPI00202CC4CD|nr:GAF domain-containing protein [Geomonas sp. Red32]MCM0080339.1 GAF domain-containing protein [Geomonas sp. Red32]